MTPIPAAKPIIGDDEREAVDRVLRSGMIAQGPEVAAFEQRVRRPVVGGRTASPSTPAPRACTSACWPRASGPGDEVIVPSFTFAATANSVALTGATPVFADIEPDHFCLDPAAVEAAITERTVAIMPVHLYGHPADMDALRRDRRRARPADLRGRRAGARRRAGRAARSAPSAASRCSASTRPRT